MPDLKNYLSVTLSVADKISYVLLFFIASGMGLNLDFFAINPDDYDYEIKVAYNCWRHLSLFLAVLLYIFLLKKKHPKILYIEVILWIVFIFYLPYSLFQIPSLTHVHDQGVPDIVYFLCSSWLLLPAVSLLYKKPGQYVLFLLCLIPFSNIYLLPEFKEITALESCSEGKCEQAIKMGIIKLENDEIIYIPHNER